MLQLQTICSAPISSIRASRVRPVVVPGVIGRRLLPLVTIGALVASLAAAPRTPAFVAPVIVQDSDVSILRDKAEAARAALLADPGVAAVALSGLRQSGLDVQYSAGRLAGFGLTPASLASALPVDQARSEPGHFVLQPGAPALQEVADLKLSAAGRTVRLGDVALVVRTKLATPVSTLKIAGQPSVRLSVVSVR